MKKVTYLLIFSSLLFSCKKSEGNLNFDDSQSIEQKQKELSKYPTTVTFNKVLHDFGEIQQGEVVETEFIVKNTGKNDLYILDAFASCGCTIPEVSKEPLKSGESTPIKVKFDSNGKSGFIEKSVNIRCNTSRMLETVKIKANIKTNK
ncbi:MAG: DUF1573 domain-containing protein [Flavobacterium sp.]|jgi:hypothetical protein